MTTIVFGTASANAVRQRDAAVCELECVAQKSYNNYVPARKLTETQKKLAHELVSLGQWKLTTDEEEIEGENIVEEYFSPRKWFFVDQDTDVDESEAQP